MTKLIATRISDEAYSKLLTKCAGLSCSTYDYLRMLVETELGQPESKKAENGKKYITFVKEEPKKDELDE